MLILYIHKLKSLVDQRLLEPIYMQIFYRRTRMFLVNELRLQNCQLKDVQKFRLDTKCIYFQFFDEESLRL